ncbi:hypothetical protein AAG570_007206 [Ranatra chinensis]|uniref:Reverse transcriptase domain-containing protein n=1 Tax=Ranatra chinensis TaxID=642074 RepID=A0ABD0YJ04_9HEMI
MSRLADDICILTSHPDPLSVSESLQDHLDNLNSWCKRWRIRINQSKSVHLTFTLRRQSCPPIMFDNIPIPPANHVHYLGLYINKRVTWNPHTRLKRLDLNRKYGLLRQLLNRNSKLSIENKFTIYKTILKPTWTYGIELRGSAKKGNIDRIQSFQSKVLNAPCGGALPPWRRRSSLVPSPECGLYKRGASSDSNPGVPLRRGRVDPRVLNPVGPWRRHGTIINSRQKHKRPFATVPVRMRGTPRPLAPIEFWLERTLRTGPRSLGLKTASWEDEQRETTENRYVGFTVF